MRTFRSKLGGFMPRVSADVAQLAANMRKQLLTRDDMQSLRETLWDHRVPEGSTVYDMLHLILTDLPDEGFKLFPWVVREVKRGSGPKAPVNPPYDFGINKFNKQHAMDIITQAIHWMVWAREHNKPLPDMMSKDFDFKAMQDWVYEMNSAQAGEGGWQDSKPVYTFPDGWHIDHVGSQDLAREGELMGHCVGGYCNSVDTERSTIYSLRDPKGEPHVTIELDGPPIGRRQGVDLNIVQTQGKSNRAPLPEYQEKVDEWFDALRGEGYDVEVEDPEREPETEYIDHWQGPFHFEEPQSVLDYYDIMRDQYGKQDHFGEDEEGEYNQNDNTYYYQSPRELQFPLVANGTLETLSPIVSQFVQELISNPGEHEHDIDQFVQGLFTAVRHRDARTYNYGAGPDYWKLEWDRLIQTAEQTAKQTTTPQPQKIKQPTLFEPSDYNGERPTPIQVTAMIEYMKELRNAPDRYEAPYIRWSQHPETGQYGYWPTGEIQTHDLRFPGEGYGNYTTQFPDYFNHIGMPGIHLPGTYARYVASAPLLARLRKIANTPYAVCPFDGSELDLHFHGGADCPTCGHEFEVGREGVVYPSDNTIEEQAATWPDTLPQGWHSSFRSEWSSK